MTLLLLLFLLTTQTSELSTATTTTNQQAYLILPATCLTKAEITPDTAIEFPLVNGQPDKHHPILRNIKITYYSDCTKSFIQIRREGEDHAVAPASDPGKR